MNSTNATFNFLFVVALVLALGIGFYAGVELNPKPTQVIIEKVIVNKIAEKRIPVRVVVEKHVNHLPNVIRSRGKEVDCSDQSKLVMTEDNSGWADIPVRDKNEDPDGHYWLSQLAMREASMNLTKSILLDKVQCRLELNKIELDFLTALINREDKDVVIKN